MWTVDREGDESWIGDFTPIDGRVVLRISVDPATVDHLLVTIEPANSEPSEPGATAWAAA
jgi:hypothetical protein